MLQLRAVAVLSQCLLLISYYLYESCLYTMDRQISVPLVNSADLDGLPLPNGGERIILRHSNPIRPLDKTGLHISTNDIDNLELDAHQLAVDMGLHVGRLSLEAVGGFRLAFLMKCHVGLPRSDLDDGVADLGDWHLWACDGRGGGPATLEDELVEFVELILGRHGSLIYVTLLVSLIDPRAWGKLYGTFQPGDLVENLDTLRLLRVRQVAKLLDDSRNPPTKEV